MKTGTLRFIPITLILGIGLIMAFWIFSPKPDITVPDFHQDIPVVRLDPYKNPPASPDEKLPPGDWGTEFTAENVTIIGFGGGGGGSCGFYPYNGLNSVQLGDPQWNNVGSCPVRC